MNRPRKPARRRRARVSTSSRPTRSLLKRKTLAAPKKKAPVYHVKPDPLAEQQLKNYEEGLQYFQQQKYAKAKPVFEKVTSRSFPENRIVHTFKRSWPPG